MKKYILIAVYLLILNNTYSQNPYYDAIKLSGYIEIGSDPSKFIIPDETEDNNRQKEIMKEYCEIINSYYNNKFKSSKDVHQNVGPIEIGGKLNPDYNPFLGPLLSPGEVQSVSSVISLGAKMSSAFSSIGNLDVTNIADGLAKFLVERVKQELSIAFFERFKNDLDSNKQLKLIFPASFRALRAIDTDIYNYSLYLDLLRESFQKDLAFLIPNIDKLVRDKSMNIIFSEYPEVRTMLSDALYIVNEFSEGNFPGEVFHNYVVNKANIDSLQKVNEYIFPSLKTLDLFSQSLLCCNPNF